MCILYLAPNGELVPAKIVQQPDQDYKVEYSSKYTGKEIKKYTRILLQCSRFLISYICSGFYQNFIIDIITHRYVIISSSVCGFQYSTYEMIITGRHTVEILYAGQAIMGSPFYVEIYDPNKIRVEGVKSGMIGETIGFDSKINSDKFYRIIFIVFAALV